MENTKKIYFASDFHLGSDAAFSSKERELMIVEWLDQIEADAKEIYFIGDIFDYWFEYKSVVPKGFVHFIGKVAELRRKGVEISFFTGNHDMWMFSYFEEELGIPVIRNAVEKVFSEKKFYLQHGDGLPTDKWVNRFMKKAFANPFLQWCYARLHPNFAIGLMRYFSNRSRKAHQKYDLDFQREKEVMIDYSEKLIKTKRDIDYIVMGHRHLPIDCQLTNGKTRHINLGDWITHFSYGVFDGENFSIQFFKDEFRIYP